jgi:hypothetical protein
MAWDSQGHPPEEEPATTGPTMTETHPLESYQIESPEMAFVPISLPNPTLAFSGPLKQAG